MVGTILAEISAIQQATIIRQLNSLSIVEQLQDNMVSQILHMQNHECGSYNAKYRLDDAKYRLDDGFEMSTGFRSPRKPMF